MTTVSVIVTTYEWDRFGAFRETINSLKQQTYDDIEIVCPVDGGSELADCTRVIADGGAEISKGEDTGLAAARNRGAEMASGDIYAFIDDDCRAVPEWVETLVRAYDDGALAAGGSAQPDWPSRGRPWYLPRQFDWLVGCGPYHDEEQTVRNTYGCNISFRADVFDALGGFDESLGKQGSLKQAEETELCKRLRQQYGVGVRYLPEAVVYHRVDPEQLELGYLLERSYMQGVSKAEVGVDEEETGFLSDVLTSLVKQAPHRSVASLAWTATTGIGFLRGGST